MGGPCTAPHLKHYLYYHDWGSNLGSNWVISTDYNRTEVIFCSTKFLYNLAVSDLSVKSFLVNSKLGWLEDRLNYIDDCFTFFL